MEEERMAILRMVAENKISAEDAAQLLDALKDSERETEKSTTDTNRPTGFGPEEEDNLHRRRHRRHRRHRHRHEHAFDWGNLSDMVGDLGGMFKDMFGGGGPFGAGGPFGDMGGERMKEKEQRFDIPEGAMVRIVLTGGHLTVRGTDGGQMRICVEGTKPIPAFLGPKVRVDQERKRVQVNATGHNLTVELPWRAVGVRTRVTGGDVALMDLSAAVDAHHTGGNLTLKDITGVVTTHTVGGNVDMADIQSNEIDVRALGGQLSVGLRTLSDGAVNLTALSGNVAVTLPSDSAFEVEATTRLGHISTNMPDAEAPEIHHGRQTLRHVYNGGGAMLSIQARAGNIDLNVSDPSATQRMEETEETAS